MALVDFDLSEEILSNNMATNEISAHNGYRIKVKLANSYWQLGDEYHHLALQEILAAEKLYNDNKQSQLFTQQDQRLLVNNLCWYKLELYIKTQAEKHYLEAEKQYRQLENFLNSTDSHNAYDTAMWFCYQTYRKTKNRAYLDQAKKFCMEAMRGKKIYATNKIFSEDLFRAHFQEIMTSD